MASLKKHVLTLGYTLSLLGTASSMAATSLDNPALTPSPTVQTLVFLRHAEKPEAGLGQLNCQGLNRAISLSHLLPERFGPAQYIFAANPSRSVEEGPKDNTYHYIRPLITIAPTAIRLGLPVNIEFGANDVEDFVDEILRSKYHNKTIYTAWSRGYLPKVINELLSEIHADDDLKVQAWSRDDFDTVFMLKLDWQNGQNPRVTLVGEEQRLDGGNQNCPEPEEVSQKTMLPKSA